jgi:hypothetical protein
MYYKTVLVIIMVLITVPIMAAEESKVEAEVKSVVVYPDRAKITRVVKLDLGVGSHKIIVENLPTGAIDGTIRTSASGVQGKTMQGITMLGMSHSTHEHVQTPNKKVAKLKAELKRLGQDEKQAVLDRLATFAGLQKFVGALSDQAAQQMTGEVAAGRIDVAQWGAAYTFIGEKNFSLNDSIRLAQQELEQINSHSHSIQNDIRKLSVTRSRMTKTVQVDLELARAGEVELTVEYLTPGAQWKPLYDARLGDISDQVQFTYYAEVIQRTGEDWTDVELTLSTAQPSLGAGPGDLPPWYLAVGHPRQVRSSVGATGQIKGRLTVANTGQPVIGASILVVGSTQGAMTDYQGNYRILRMNPGFHKLRISHLEYVTIDVTSVGVMSGRVSEINRRMTPKVTDLDDIITVIGTPDILDRFMVDSRVNIGQEFIKRRPVMTVDNLLEQVAGVRTTADREVFVRGGRAGKVAYTVEGEPIGDPLGSGNYARGYLPLVSGSIASSGAYPITFKIKRKETVPSGDEAVRVTVADWKFEGETKLIARPRNRSGAFRVVKLHNQDAAPLMPGPLAIFAGTHYLGQTQFNRLITPGEEFDLPFGLDNRITVERKVLAFKKTLKGKKVKIDQTIQITLQNHGDVARTVDLEESIPISRDNRVKVKLRDLSHEPEGHDEQGKLTWKLTLEPDAKVIVTIPYRITYPRDLQVSGL